MIRQFIAGPDGPIDITSFPSDDLRLPPRIAFVGHKGSGKDTAAGVLDDLGYEHVKFAGGLKAMLRAALSKLYYSDGLIDEMLEGSLKEQVVRELNLSNFDDVEILETMLDALLEYTGMCPTKIQMCKRSLGGLSGGIPALCGMTYMQAMGSLKTKWLEAAFQWSHQSISPRWAMQTLGTEWGRQCVAEDFWIRITLKRVELFRNVVVTDCRFMNEAMALRGADFFILKINRPGLEVDLSHQSEREIAMIPENVAIENDGSIVDLFAKTRDTLYRRG